MRRVVIVGGGISGLAAAHRLCELKRERSLPLEIRLLEAGGRFGGVIETRSREGFLLETGADAFLSEKSWAADLCRRIGLADEMIPTQQEFRRSWIIRGGKLMPVPEGIYLIAPAGIQPLLKTSLLSWRGKARMACEWMLPPRRDEADESVARFIRRRFGAEALERIGRPMIGGIYGADLERLSLQATLPRFRELELRYGSVSRGLAGGRNRANGSAFQASGPRYSLFLSLRGGMQQLVERLVARMPEAQLRNRATVSKIERSGRGWKIHLQEGEHLEAETLCLALPAHQAAKLLREPVPELAGELSEIPYESVATLNLAFREGAFSKPARGFGMVRPPSEPGSFIGCTFSSMKFPGRAPGGTLLLRAFIGGAHDSGAAGKKEEVLVQAVLEDLKRLLGLREEPLLSELRRHPVSMPQYPVGHLNRVAAIEEKRKKIAGLHLAGNGYRGVGIPDCIRQGEQAAEEIALECHLESRRDERSGSERLDFSAGACPESFGRLRTGPPKGPRNDEDA